MATTPQQTQTPPPGSPALLGIGTVLGVAALLFIAVGTRDLPGDPAWKTFRQFLAPVGHNPLVPLTLLGIQVFIFGLSPLAFERPRNHEVPSPAGHRVKDHLNEASWTSAAIVVFITIYCVILAASALVSPSNLLIAGLIAAFSVLLSGTVHRLFLEMVDKRSPAERKRLALMRMKNKERYRLRRAWLPETANHDEEQGEVSLLSSIVTIGGVFTIFLTAIIAVLASPSPTIILLGLTIGVNSVVLALAFRWISLALFGRRDRASDRILWTLPALAVALLILIVQIFVISGVPASSLHPGRLIGFILIASAVYSLVFLLLYVEVGRTEIRTRISELTVEISDLSDSLAESQSAALAATLPVCDATDGYPQ